MTIHMLNMDEINAVSGGFFFSWNTQVIQPLPECQHVAANGKCEDDYTSPPIIPQIEPALF